MSKEFDAIVLGAGAPGEVCAGRLADGRLSVAIVESHLVGGECSYYACMPSKALLRPADLLGEAKRVPGVAEAVGGELDPEAVLVRRDEVIHALDDSAQLPWLEQRGIELFRGPGRLDGERRVIVRAVEVRGLRIELAAHATREDNTYYHRWRVGDVLIWDERATMHRGAGDYRPDERRIMLRTIVYPN